MKKVTVLLSAIALLVGSTGAVHPAASMYGLSGLVETPDDTIAAPNSLMVSGSYITDFGNTNFNLMTYGGAIAIMPNLEVGAVAIDNSAPGIATQALINAKFRVVPETLGSPSICVGVVDATNRLEKMDARIDKPSAFVVFGKNISAAAEGVSGLVSKPIRGTVGFGTGIYRGFFAGLNMSAAPKFDIAVEYLSEGLRQQGTGNAIIRFRPTEMISIEAGAFAFKDLYLGGTFILSTY